MKRWGLVPVKKSKSYLDHEGPLTVKVLKEILKELPEDYIIVHTEVQTTKKGTMRGDSPISHMYLDDTHKEIALLTTDEGIDPNSCGVDRRLW